MRGLAALEAVRPLAVRPEVAHAYHLYVVQIVPEALRVDRGQVFSELRPKASA